MDFGNPNKEIVSSYLDVNAFDEKVIMVSTELTMLWVQYMGDTLDQVLRKLSEDDQNGAQEAFLGSLQDAEKNTLTMATKIGELLAEQIGDIYHVAYNEGAAAANNLFAKTMRKLIEEEKLPDPDGRIEQFLKVSQKHQQEYMAKVMKGKNLNIYSVDKKDNKEE